MYPLVEDLRSVEDLYSILHEKMSNKTTRKTKRMRKKLYWEFRVKILHSRIGPRLIIP